MKVTAAAVTAGTQKGTPNEITNEVGIRVKILLIPETPLVRTE
jgi:hypothetical protein